MSSPTKRSPDSHSPAFPSSPAKRSKVNNDADGPRSSPDASIKTEKTHQEDFTTFVESALSPLATDFTAQSPSMKILGSQEDSNLDSISSTRTNGTNLGTNNAMWSPGGLHGSDSNLTSNEFKMNFDSNPLSQSSSPIFNQATRNVKTKKFDHSGYDDAAEQETVFNNRQALAERLTGSGSDVTGIAVSSSSGPMPDYLGSSLSLDIGSPLVSEPANSTGSSNEPATGRGARERKATPKSRALASYQYHRGNIESSGPGVRSRYNAAATSTPTAEFLDLGLNADRGPMTCNCKKSRCLKLYCECFHALKFCNQNCKCYDCENRMGNDSVRNVVINQIKERDPHAFESKIRLDGDTNTRGHLSGCHCKRTACLKKYCECFTLAVPCSQRCRCIKCQNTPALYEVKIDEAKYTAAMLVSAAASAIDSAGGDEYLTHANSYGARNDTSSEEGGYDSRGRSSVSSRQGNKDSPVSDSGRRYGAFGASGVPNSPGMSLLELAGACSEEQRTAEAREGLLALSPNRKPPVRHPVEDVRPLSEKLQLDRE